MSGTIQSRAKRPPALLLPLLAGPGSGLPLRSPPILRCAPSRPAASSGGAAATAREANFGQRRSHARTRRWLRLTAPGEPSLPFGKACEDPFLRVFFYPKQSET